MSGLHQEIEHKRILTALKMVSQIARLTHDEDAGTALKEAIEMNPHYACALSSAILNEDRFSFKSQSEEG